MYLYNKVISYLAQDQYDEYLVRATLYLHENTIFDQIICVYKNNKLLGKLLKGELQEFSDESVTPIIDKFNNELRKMGYEV